MGIYFLSDIASTFSGDLKLDSKGDIDLSNSVETQKALTNFWLRTDQGEYVPNPSIGCNLGSFIGTTNSPRTLEQIETQTHNILTRNLWFPEDLKLRVVPLSQTELMIGIQLRGQFSDISGNLTAITPQVITYSFPFLSADPSPIIG